MPNSDDQIINGYEKSGAEKESEQISKTLTNVESNQPKLPYPKRVFFIIGNEFCERFNYYGMKAILVLYLKGKLGFTEIDATVLYHIFAMLCYFTCIFGGIISDVWWGKFKTILILSVVYAIGSTTVSVGAIPVIKEAISPKIGLYIGLFLIAIGSGGIKPCVSAFGGDQFKLPEQAKQVATYFSLFYFSINSGSLISTTLTPILREDVKCFGENDCFSIAFGVPALLMAVSIVFFLFGKSSYTYIKTSSENMLFRMAQCTTNAITTFVRERKTNPRTNLLDYSIPRYGHQLVSETRVMLRILLLYVPLPFFWALFDQQGSRWTFQANRMNGDLGFYTIKPDQMQMINPLMILVFIPVFEIILYPFLSMIGIRRPLQKLTLGGILAGVSFIISAFVESTIESSPEKSVSMLWQLPQYIVMTLAEVMFSVTGLSFSYEQAPESMKSVVQAFWLLTVAFGNVIIVLIAEAEFFDSLVYEFLLFAGLMFIDMFIFIVLAYFYKSSVPNNEETFSINSDPNESTEQHIPLNKFEEKTNF